jgi:hypothetical protein
VKLLAALAIERGYVSRELINKLCAWRTGRTSELARAELGSELIFEVRLDYLCSIQGPLLEDYF